MNINLILAFTLCSLSWIAVSVSLSDTVKAKSGQDVTLLCPNISKSETTSFWFRLVNKTQANCIASMSRSYSQAEYCKTTYNEKFDMRSNKTTMILKIRPVDVSDSGLYFCGFYESGHPMVNIVYLNVRGSNETTEKILTEQSDEPINAMNWLFNGLTAVLVVTITGLIIIVWRLQKVSGYDVSQHENVDSDTLKAAALSLYSTKVRKRRHAERQEETHVIYTFRR